MPAQVTLNEGNIQLVPEGDDAKPLTFSPEELMEKIQTADADILDRKVSFTVDGHAQESSVQELMTAAAKVGGADARFNQAASAIHVVELLQKVRTNPTEVGEAEYGEVMGALGITGQERDTLMEVFQTARDNPNAFDGTQGTPNAPAAEAGAGKVDPAEARIAALEAQVSALGGTVAQTHAREQAKGIRAHIEDSVRKSLTTDQTLGKIIADEANGKPPSWSNTETFAGSFFDEMMTLVRSRVTENPERPVTPDEITGMAGRVRHRLSLVGKALEPGQASKPTALGQALGISPGFQADEPVERVKVTDPKHRTNFTDRMLQAYKKLSGKGTAG